MKDEDLIVSFDIVSLYTMIHIDEAINVIQSITNSKIVDLLKIA